MAAAQYAGRCRHRPLQIVYRFAVDGFTFLRGVIRASRPTNLYNKSGALPISSAPLNFVLCSFIVMLQANEVEGEGFKRLELGEQS